MLAVGVALLALLVMHGVAGGTLTACGAIGGGASAASSPVVGAQSVLQAAAPGGMIPGHSCTPAPCRGLGTRWLPNLLVIGVRTGVGATSPGPSVPRRTGVPPPRPSLTQLCVSLT